MEKDNTGHTCKYRSITFTYETLPFSICECGYYMLTGKIISKDKRDLCHTGECKYYKKCFISYEREIELILYKMKKNKVFYYKKRKMTPLNTGKLYEVRYIKPNL
jgi:hypothetical protein